VLAVAGQARLVDELVLEAIDDGSLRLNPGSPVSGKRIVFHCHCHQKALAGTAATVALLRRVPGAVVVELDAGCCGMAGSFGFEAEHYELSMQIGETRLFPALRGEDADTLVAATGVSCRQQITHGVGRDARHPVQIVRAAL
jgi:Fe-S oxidoreductase